MKRILMALALVGLAGGAWAQSLGTPGIGFSRGTAGAVVTLDVKSTAVPTSGTSAEVLATYTVPAGKWGVNNQAIRVTAWFSTAANANAKTTTLKLGGLAGDTCTTRGATDNNARITHICTWIRTGAATQDWWGRLSTNTVAMLTSAGTAAQSTAADIALVATATTATAAGDATFEGWIVEFISVQ